LEKEKFIPAPAFSRKDIALNAGYMVCEDQMKIPHKPAGSPMRPKA
jgi:hypothetical protein